MLLALDIGNSHIVLGVFAKDELLHTWRLATDHERTSDEYSMLLCNLIEHNGCRLDDIDGCVMGNVVPALQETFEQVCRSLFGFEPLSVDAQLDTGVEILTDFPMEVGADRIVNAAAVHERHRGPAIVIDFGTATTFDVVSVDGNYVGGAIAPGVVLAAEALTARAARLFRVELTVPERAIGKNTTQALQSGTMFGYIGLVEGLVERITRELGERPIVVATGGLARTVARHSTMVDVVDPDLTLHGLRLVYERQLPDGDR
jgi:type III pantothenate kinase